MRSVGIACLAHRPRRALISRMKVADVAVRNLALREIGETTQQVFAWRKNDFW
jgi:hypothetical protein